MGRNGSVVRRREFGPSVSLFAFCVMAMDGEWGERERESERGGEHLFIFITRASEREMMMSDVSIAVVASFVFPSSDFSDSA